MSSENVIPQREWEDYVQIRDRINALRDLPKESEEADVEYGKLSLSLDYFYEKYDSYDLEIRYQESLKEKP